MQKNQNEYWIIYTDSSFKNLNKIEQFPNIKNHLDKFTKVMTSDNKPYGLHRARDEFFFKGEKIMAVRKCATPTFSYIDFDSYVSRAFFVIKTKRLNQKYLTGILNSKLITFWLQKKGKLQGFQFQIDKDPIINIPIVEGTAEQQSLVSKIVEYILHLKPNIDETEANGKLIISYFEQIIDALVYELYLTNEIYAAGKEFFVPLVKENLPYIKDIKGDKILEISRVFERLFNRDHIIRQNIFFLDTIESVRIIEGKV